MSDKPVDPVSVEVGGITLNLRYGGRAKYRLQSLGAGVDLLSLRKQGQQFAALCNWLWALAIDCPFKRPEDIADVVESDDMAEMLKAVLQAVSDGTQPDDVKKNG